MTDALNNYEKYENKMNFQELNSFEEKIESFTIGAEEAAQILGVNRSRLSQLTSKGTLAFERRKIDTRNRLFYRLSDLLNHQRTQMQPNSVALQFTEEKLKNSKEQQENTHSPQLVKETENTRIKVKLKQNNRALFSKNIFSAKEIFLKEEEKSITLKGYEEINIVKNALIEQREEINNIRLKIIKQEILNSNNQNKLCLSNNKVQKLNSILQNKIDRLLDITHSLEFKIKRLSESKVVKNNSWKKKKPKFLIT